MPLTPDEELPELPDDGDDVVLEPWESDEDDDLEWEDRWGDDDDRDDDVVLVPDDCERRKVGAK